MPRLKGIASQKLVRPGPGCPDDYHRLQPIFTRPINWALIHRQYDEMSKYATALRLVYVNTLMFQQVLEDQRALSPLVYHHVYPYGSFELDLGKRLPIDTVDGL